MISDMYDVLTSIKYIVEVKECIIPDVKNVKNTRKVHKREAWVSKDTNHGGKRVQMLAEDDHGEILRIFFHKYAHGTKEMQLKLSHQLLNCDDVKGDSDKDKKIGGVICGIYQMSIM